MRPTTGVLLVNVGTPDAPETPEVRRYLREFLSDPRVIDINPVGRWLLLELFILPFRPQRSAAAYRAIWTGDGSPLLVHSRSLRDRLAEELGEDFVVEIGMRYGNPSMVTALEALRRRPVQRLIIVPLYPQHSAAASSSVIARAMDTLREAWDIPHVELRGAFHDHAGFIDALVDRAAAVRDELRPDTILFSYHGLPERHVQKSDAPSVACDRKGACPALGPDNAMCYRAQCYETSRRLAAGLGLAGGYHVAFQSRLGRTPWIVPYSDQIVERLYAAGGRRLLVCCPSFVADCLETLEEIGIRLDEQWRGLGGEALRLVPAVNDHPTWVKGLARMIRG